MRRVIERSSHLAAALGRAAIGACVATSLAATPAAGQAVYTDRAAFLAALASPETYSAPFPLPCTPSPSCPQPNRLFHVGPLELTSGAIWIEPGITPPGPAFGWNLDANSGPIDLPGPADAPWTTLHSARPLYAFGLDYGAPAAAPPPIALPTVFTFALGNGLTFARPTLVGGLPGGPPVGTMRYQFFGVISPTTFDEITIAASNAESFFAVNGARYDDVTIAATPEPTTLLLLAGGLCAIGAVARRQRRVPKATTVGTAASAVAAAALALALAAAPAAGQTVFSDRAAFLAAIGPSATYSAPFPAGCPGPTCTGHERLFALGPLAVTSGALWTKLVRSGALAGPAFGWEPDAFSGPPGSPGPADAIWTTFQSPVPLHAMGVAYGAPIIVPCGPGCNGPTEFTFALGDGPTFTRPTLVGTPPSSPGMTDYQFFGVVSPTPFTTFRISATNPLEFGLVNVARYDRITVATVPEPGTLALVGGGLVALIAGALGGRDGRARRGAGDVARST